MGNNKKFWMVKKETLIAIAGIVWCAAGINVARLGIISYTELEKFSHIYLVLSLIIFSIFGSMFMKMSRKNAGRIRGEEAEYNPFWTFFDAKSYLIMICMMSFGIALRASHIMPERFIAYFYTGLGLALALAGVSFIVSLYKGAGEK